MKNKMKVTSGYLFAIPVVLVILVLYSGILRFLVPAVTINGTAYKVVDFDYYYFSIYHELTEDPAWVLQSGFQETVAPEKQMYTEDTTWKEHFIALAIQRLSLIAYYSDAAREAGYECASLEASVQQRKSEIEDFCALNSIKASNYYKAYYGSSMSEERYLEHYRNEVYAMEYRNYLLEEREISAAEITQYCETHNLSEYQTANVSMLALDAAPDRFTGEVGELQLEQLQAKLDQLEARYLESGQDFQTVRSTLYEGELGAETGVYQNLTHYMLPQSIDSWIYNRDRTPGDYTTIIEEDSHTAYLVVFDGWGENGAELEAKQALRQEKTDKEEEEALQGTYQAVPNDFGLRITAT